ncbi:MAG: transporter substrate-binding domain-containing protein [Spirochaetes bacterium]|nr:transporter substrate-binding domain-containing protein [Spirochaetota bacterium]
MKEIFMLIVCLSFFLFPVNTAPAFCNQLNFNQKNITISAIENDYIHSLIKDIVRTAYKRLGIKVNFFELPARRSLEWANIGRTDADLARIDNTETKYSNLIKIPVPLLTIKGVVFTKNITRDVHKWEDLSGLSIGIRSGIRYSVIRIEGFNRIIAKDLFHLFSLLSRDRIDVAVADYDMGRYKIAKHFHDSGIHIIGKPLSSRHLYHYIHKKNKNISKKLELVLRDMSKSGEMDIFREKAAMEAMP